MAFIRKKGDYWHIVYTHNGKRVEKSLKTKSKREAQNAQKAIEAKLLDGEVPAFLKTRTRGKNPLVDDFWETYVEYAKQHKRPKTVEIETNFWKQLIEFTKPERLGDITKADIERFKAWKNKEGAAPQTINNALKDIQTIFGYAVRLELFDGDNPAKDVQRFTLERRLPKFHTEEEAQALLEAAKDHSKQLEWVVLLGIWAGLRKAEIVNMRWEYFDFNKKHPQIKLRSHGDFNLKSHEERAIPMNKRIRDSFYPLRKKEGYVFETNRPSNGKYRYRYEPKKALVSALTKAGLSTDRPFHRLRYTFGSLLVQNGVSITKVSRWLGHSSVKTTERYYISLLDYDDDINAI